MAAQRKRFVDGAVKQGLTEEHADTIFDLLARFADYGFNKSHSAPYALITYQTAWMKANHPAEFMAASMALETANTEKLAEFRREAIRLGIPVEAPSVNRSGVDFDVAFEGGDGRILYSLAAIKGVGGQAVEHLVAVREAGGPFVDLADFARRISPKQLNKRVLESLVAAGALDELEPDRARVFSGIDRILSMAARVQDSAAVGQTDMFGGAGEREPLLLAAVEPWLAAERLKREHDAIGFYLSAHPLDDYGPLLQKLRVQTHAEFTASVRNGATAGRLAGTVTSRQERRIRTGNKMGVVQLSDPTGSYEAILFSEGLSEYRDMLEPGKSVVVIVSAEERPEGVSIRIQSVESLDKVVSSLKQVRVFLRDEAPLPSIEKHLAAKGDGEVSLVLVLEEGKREVEMRLPGKRRVSPQIASALRAVKGVVQVEMV
jgi:DNA polymerase-3 subunit alpha